MNNDKSTVVDTPEKVEAYYDFIQPLMVVIRDAIVKHTNENPNKYSALDLHSGLATTMSYLVARNIELDQRKTTADQAGRLTEVMIEAAIKDLNEQDFYVSLLLASIQATTMAARMVENASGKEEE